MLSTHTQAMTGKGKKKAEGEKVRRQMFGCGDRERGKSGDLAMGTTVILIHTELKAGKIGVRESVWVWGGKSE